MHKCLKDKHGFTIVELLVVIVVIGIISTIGIVSYSAYLRNTRNTYTATVASSYINALNLYKLENNNYPSFPENQGHACLGEGNDLLNDGSKVCVLDTVNVSPDPITESTTLNNALRPYFSGDKLPRASDYIVYNGPQSQWLLSGIYVGDFWGNQTKLDGIRHPWQIVYFQEGASTKCPIGPVASYIGNDASGIALFSSTPPASGYTFTFGDNAVSCYVFLPAIATDP